MTTTSTTTVADRYELAERIGGGGGGSVWRARDTDLGRTVAVKLVTLEGDLTEQERERARTRVAREARATARLNHPAIPSVFDTVIEDARVAIVMAYVDAPNLRQLVSTEGPLDDEQVAGVARQMADVLAAAHEAGVVHRDIKPSNVLLTRDGEVRLTDFGIASVGDETRLTRTGHTMGSPSYLAPEQARGEDPSPAADLWGLGATLYFAITGVSPFDRGGPLPSMHAVLHDDPAPPERDSVLWPLVVRLLSKQPEARPTVGQVREYLRDPAAAAAAAADERTETVPLPDEEHGAAGAVASGSAEAAAAAGTGDHAEDDSSTWGGRRGVIGVVLALVAAAALVTWTEMGTDGGAVDDVTDPDTGTEIIPQRDPGDFVDQEPATGDTSAEQEPAVEEPAEPTSDGGGQQRPEPDPGGPPGEDGPPGQDRDPGNGNGNPPDHANN